MLVDNSGSSLKRVLEITSQDCKWRTKTGDSSWSAVDQPQLLSLPDKDGDEMTGFKMEQSPKGQKMLYVKLLCEDHVHSATLLEGMHQRMRSDKEILGDPTKGAGWRWMEMDGDGWRWFVDVRGTYGSNDLGEHFDDDSCGVTRLRFETSESWTDLGGSEVAASYLNEADAEGDLGPRELSGFKRRPSDTHNMEPIPEITGDSLAFFRAIADPMIEAFGFRFTSFDSRDAV
eukprot:Skav203515  [mRNA]  locus=scaffold687:13583:15952:+ [translate_table: standard]